MTEYFNRAEQKNRRRALRRQMPRAEKRLRWRLRYRQLDGLRFRRQCSIGAFVVDFYCPEKRLAIEVDGDSHFHRAAQQRDAARQRFIESLGITVLRFPNQQVFKDMPDVLTAISETAARIARE